MKTFIKENPAYAVAIIAMIITAILVLVAMSNPPTSIIKTHNMDNEVSCYTYAGNIDCLQVVK